MQQCKTTRRLLRYMLAAVLCMTFVCIPIVGRAEVNQVKSDRVTLSLKNVSVEQFFSQINKQTGYNIVSSSDLTKKLPKISVTAENEPIKNVLDRILSPLGCVFDIDGRVITVYGKINGARERTISGYVRDESGEALVGVPVCIGESRVCTVTDEKGYFIFKIPTESCSLKFTYVGMNTKYVKVPAGRTTIHEDVTMENSTNLDEVVVVGYGSTQRKDLTGSVTTVNPHELENLPSVTLDDALQGKAAGVMVTKADGSPGGAVRIRVRGGASLTGGVDPLYIIDGIPTEIKNNYITSTDIVNPIEAANYGEDFGNSISGSFARGLNSLSGLNINDIESITIMKDASATAIYGSKAANGVVIITTKRGRKDMKPTFNFNYGFTVTNPVKEKLLDGSQYVSALEEAINNSNRNLAANAASLSNAQSTIAANNALLATIKGLKNANTDWLDEVLRTGYMHNADLSVQGGSNSSRYYASMSYTGQDGTLIGTDFTRYTGNINLDTDITQRFRTLTKVSIGYTKNNITNGVYGQAVSAPPILPIYNDDGSYADYGAIGGVASAYMGYQNPVAVATSTNQAKTYDFKGSIAGEYDIMKDLKFRTTLSINYTNYNQLSYIPSYVLVNSYYGAEDSEGGAGSQSQSTSTNTFWENTLTYNHDFNEIHHFDAVIGHSWENDKANYFSASGKGYPDDRYLNNLSSASLAASVAGSNPSAETSLLSFYARMNYILSDRYLFTFTGRSDASSKFSKDHRVGYFPSGAIAWRINKEKFLSNAKWIDELKLRASIGKTGTQNISDFMFMTLYAPDSYADKSALYPYQLGNDEIKWESTVQKDLGLDFSFFAGRLGGTVAYYHKVTDDALLNVTPAPSSGFGTVVTNIAKIRNIGAELELYAEPIRTRDFRWTLAFNISQNKSKVMKLQDTQFSSATDRKALNLGTSLIREGESLGLLCGRKAVGILKTQEQVDDYKSRFRFWPYMQPDVGIGSIELELDDTGFYFEDVIGNCTPDFYGGFTNTFTYKNWALSTVFTYSVGNDLIYQKDVSDASFSSTANRSTRVLEASTLDHITDRPMSMYNMTNFLTNLNVYDASYLKLQTISLSYSLSKKVLRQLKLTSGQIYALASNVFTITSYPGPDPAVSDDPYTISGGGRDASTYPTVKSFTLGVRLGF